MVELVIGRPVVTRSTLPEESGRFSAGLSIHAMRGWRGAWASMAGEMSTPVTDLASSAGGASSKSGAAAESSALATARLRAGRSWDGL